MDRGMNDLLKWSIENSQSSNPQIENGSANDGQSLQAPERPINMEALRSLMGGPSDADLMKESMAIIHSPDTSLDDKTIAFDNFEQLIETIDNANNIDSLGLWSPLISVLGSKEAELRKFAAWCIGTAVQNNVKAQEKVLALDAIPLLIRVGVEDESEAVRRKAIYALSSEIRNYQPALDEAVKHLPKQFAPEGAINSTDMTAVDQIVNGLREESSRKSG